MSRGLPFFGEGGHELNCAGKLLMRVSQAVVADRHAETTIDVMGDAHAPAAASLVGFYSGG